MKTVSEIVRLGPVIPVLAFDSVEQGEHVSRALHVGGVKVPEITLIASRRRRRARSSACRRG